MSNPTERQRERVLLLAVCLATPALALGRFGQSLWRDEGTSVWFARLPLATLLAGLCDPHPAGYYLFLKAWLAGGEGEFWLRLPSLVAAVLAVALTYRVGQEAGGGRWAWLAALLLAVHPLQSWYAGEARMYALAQSLGLVAVWQGLRLLRQIRGTHRWYAGGGYWLAALLALGVDSTVLLPIGLLQLHWLARGHPGPRSWLSWQAAVMLPAGLLWASTGQLEGLRRSYPAVLLAIQANRLGYDLTPAVAAALLQIATIALVLAGLGLAWFWYSRPGRRMDQPLLRLLVVVGWLGLLGLAALPRAYTVKRQVVVLLPYLALLTGYALSRLPRPGGEAVAGVGLLVTLLALPGHQREPWRAAVDHLIRAESGRSPVVWVDELAAPVFDYYVHHTGSETDQVRWAPLVGREIPRLPDLTPEPGGALWIVTADSVYRRIVSLLPAEFHWQYQLLEERHEVGIGLYHYQRRISPAPDQPALPAPDPVDEWGLLLPSPLDVCRAESSGR